MTGRTAFVLPDRRRGRAAPYVVALALVAAPSVAPLQAQVGADTVAALRSVVSQVGVHGATLGPSIWPGYRPDTIPLAFVLPDRGTVLAHWRGALPESFTPVPAARELAWRAARDLGAASTASEIGGRRVAQVVVSSLDPAYLIPTTLHEAFHVFEAASRRDDRRFGQSENAFYVASYPVFDVTNEAGFALEGRTLAAALSASSVGSTRALAREFVAVREARQRPLMPDFAEFDRASEMNEGLAEYALTRALMFLADSGPPEWRASARKQLAERSTRLANLTADTKQSFRLRYYSTGPAMALIMDRLAGPSWKTHMLATNEALQDALADVSGFNAPADTLHARADARFDAAALERHAREAVASLQRARRARVDSLLASPALEIVLLGDSLPNGTLQRCGIDPQNLLQVNDTVELHTRWVKLCAGAATSAEFTSPVVYDVTHARATAILPRDDTLAVSVGGHEVPLQDGQHIAGASDVRITTTHATVTTARADLARTGNRVEVRLLRSR